MDALYSLVLFFLLSMQQYDKFQEHLNAADFFQEEKLDWEVGWLFVLEKTFL